MEVDDGGEVKSSTEIGGYFSLDLPDYGDFFHDTIKFQSARATVRAVLECNEFTRVMIPKYVCGSIHKAAFDAGLVIETYDLDELLYPKNLPSSLPEQCALIYVNYFGLCQQNVTRLRREIPTDRLIIDNSHALFAAHMDVLATIYSPRKFVGLPDGGLLRSSSSLDITPPMEEDNGSIDRMRHLLLRMAYSARDGYSDFQKARNSLQDTTPLTMSRLTRRLMKSIRWDEVIRRRRENYLIVAEGMDQMNDMRWRIGENDVPLCYPLMLRGGGVIQMKKELALHNVFIPTYWPDALPSSTNSIEESLSSDTLYLPIDQRLERNQIELVCNIVVELRRKATSAL